MGAAEARIIGDKHSGRVIRIWVPEKTVLHSDVVNPLRDRVTIMVDADEVVVGPRTRTMIYDNVVGTIRIRAQNKEVIIFVVARTSIAYISHDNVVRMNIQASSTQSDTGAWSGLSGYG